MKVSWNTFFCALILLAGAGCRKIGDGVFSSPSAENSPKAGNNRQLTYGYSHDDQLGINHPAWLGALPDTLRVSQISLPGTHDTMAFYGGDMVQAQSLPLDRQLNAGIRVLDIRCRHSENAFYIHHGIEYQRANFDDVMHVVTAFLQQNQRETILMRIKEEYQPKNNSRSFEETLKAYLKTYGPVFWMHGGETQNPSLGEIRGRVVLIQDFAAQQTYGLLMNKFNLQDDYHLTTNWDLYKKWTKVKDEMHHADAGGRQDIFMNFLSGSGGSFPYFVASGKSSHGTHDPALLTGKTTPGWAKADPDFPRVGCLGIICSIAFAGTNELVAREIEKGELKLVGILMADFPGATLLEDIINLNR